MLKVRLVRSRASRIVPRGGRLLGRSRNIRRDHGAGRHLRVFREILKYEAIVRGRGLRVAHDVRGSKVPAYEGGKFPLSTYLADRGAWNHLRSAAPGGKLPAASLRMARIHNGARKCRAATNSWWKPFRAPTSIIWSAIRLKAAAHQTLGMLLTRRLERARLNRWALSPTNMRWRSGAIGDVATRIASGELSLADLFDEDMLGDDLEAWSPNRP